MIFSFVETLNDVYNSQFMRNVKLGLHVVLGKFINLYECEIGNETKIGPFVEIQKGVKIGRRCKISSHSFICDGVTIKMKFS